MVAVGTVWSVRNSREASPVRVVYCRGAESRRRHSGSAQYARRAHLSDVCTQASAPALACITISDSSSGAVITISQIIIMTPEQKRCSFAPNLMDQVSINSVCRPLITPLLTADLGAPLPIVLEAHIKFTYIASREVSAGTDFRRPPPEYRARRHRCAPRTPPAPVYAHSFGSESPSYFCSIQVTLLSANWRRAPKSA